MPEAAVEPESTLGAERDVALAETRPCLAAAGEYRRSCSTREALDRGGSSRPPSAELEPIVSSPCRPAHPRRSTGRRRAGGLRLYRKLPRGSALPQSAREVTRRSLARRAARSKARR